MPSSLRSCRAVSWISIAYFPLISMACAGGDRDEAEATVAVTTTTPGQPTLSAPSASETASATNEPDTTQPPTSVAPGQSQPAQLPTAPATNQNDPAPEASASVGEDEPEASTPATPTNPPAASGSVSGAGGTNDPPAGGEGGEGELPEAGGSDNAPSEQDAGQPETDVPAPDPNLDPFSFFVTSLAAMRALSQNDDGFGGDLKYGEADGLSGADKICAEIAELSMEGAASKQWRAFLSVSTGGADGGPIHAIDRIGEGPWYDRLGRLVSEDITGLLNERPAGDAEVVEDLPNELGEPNSFAGGVEMDNHDTLTGSDETGHHDGGTCADWTSTTSTEAPLAGHSWPARSGQHWIRSHGVHGCGPSVVDGEGSFGMGEEGGGVGDGGGYGGIYCFALSP